MSLFGPTLLQQVGRALAVGAATGAGLTGGMLAVAKIANALSGGSEPLPAKRQEPVPIETHRVTFVVTREAAQEFVAAARARRDGEPDPK